MTKERLEEIKEYIADNWFLDNPNSEVNEFLSEMVNTIENLQEEITRLQQELGREVESHRETVRVLEQYGCESFYTRATLENHKGETFNVFSDAEIDIGKRARARIAELKND